MDGAGQVSAKCADFPSVAKSFVCSLTTYQLSIYTTFMPMFSSSTTDVLPYKFPQSLPFQSLILPDHVECYA